MDKKTKIIMVEGSNHEKRAAVAERIAKETNAMLIKINDCQTVANPEYSFFNFFFNSVLNGEYGDCIVMDGGLLESDCECQRARISTHGMMSLFKFVDVLTIVKDEAATQNVSDFVSDSAYILWSAALNSDDCSFFNGKYITTCKSDSPDLCSKKVLEALK